MTDPCERCKSMLWRPATYICKDQACRYGVTGQAKAAPSRPSDRAIAQAELLPCPFCGCEVILGALKGWDAIEGDHDVDCQISGYDFRTPATDWHRERAVAAWNTRATAAPVVVGEDVLGILDDEKVFAIEVRGDKLHFYERCDEHFGTDLTTSQVRALAAELVLLANTTEAKLTAALAGDE